MAELAANTPTSDHLWGELARLVALVGLATWTTAIHTAIWEDPASTEEDVEDLVEGLRLDLLRLAAAASLVKASLCEVLELALGHLHVHEWAASTRPSMDEAPLEPVIDLQPRPFEPDPVATRTLVAAADKLEVARELAKQFQGAKRRRG